MGRNYTTEEYYKMLARNLGGEGLTLILEQDAIGQTFEIENLPTSPAGVEFDPADFVRWLKTSLADITCAACGRPFKTKSGRDNHIKNYHDMTIKEYNAQFNEYGEPRSGQ